MFSRVAFVTFALLGSACAAQAADLAPDVAIAAPAAGCNCGSNMIVVYDFEPGVVTRNWKGDCACRYVPYTRRFRNAEAPQFESLMEPWRR